MINLSHVTGMNLYNCNQFMTILHVTMSQKFHKILLLFPNTFELQSVTFEHSVPSNNIKLIKMLYFNHTRIIASTSSLCSVEIEIILILIRFFFLQKVVFLKFQSF